MFNDVISFIRKHYNITEEFIPLHVPVFTGNERKYVMETIDSTYVSSVGKFVDRFEEIIKKYTGAKYAIAAVNGTAALHMAMLLAGVKKDELVLTQALSFIATCNAITYIGAEPAFIDVDRNTLGMSAIKLKEFLTEQAEQKNGNTYHKATGKRIAACVPMHTFGHPAEIDKIAETCSQYGIALVEDAAESIGSTYKGKHTGRYGLLGTYSFNGNKTVTCGGGGVIITDDEHLGKLGKHLTTQAKVPHKWEFVHDHIGYNYRMPNINAALACAQMEQLEDFIENKRATANAYKYFFANVPEIKFVEEPTESRSNYWLNSILLKDRDHRDEFLAYANENGVMSRPVWELMNRLSMFKHCIHDNLENSIWIADRLVNIPSSVK